MIALKCQNWRAGGAPTPPGPYDYEVMYCYCDNARAIVDTGWKLNYGEFQLRIDTVCYPLVQSDKRRFVFGSYSGRASFVEIDAASTFSLGEAHGVSTVIIGERYDVHCERSINGVSATVKDSVGNIVFSGTRTTYSGTETNNYALFNLSDNRTYGDSDLIGVGRFQMETVDKYGAPLCSYIPCVKDGVACYYDELSETFKYATNGNLVAGPRI